MYSAFTTKREAGMVLAETHTNASEHPTDLDSHADTCVIGKNALIVHILNKKVNVTGFDPSFGKVKDLDLVSAALAYDCPEMGERVIQMVHQAIHAQMMTIDLLCPMQMRANEIGYKSVQSSFRSTQMIRHMLYESTRMERN